MKEVTAEDKGDYQCIVTNVHGSLNFTFIVEVISKYQGFQYFASLPVLHYLLKFEQFL